MTSSTPRTPWDGGYHLWLEHKQILRDFLTRFAPSALLEEVDLDHIEFHKTDFYLLPNFQKRDGDIVLRLPRPHHDHDAWLWLLMEVQLTQRGDMALRALGYVYGLYLHLLRHQPHLHAPAEGALRLPPIFVLVFYHGQEAWREPEDLWGLIDLPEDSPLWRFQPQLYFWLLREQQPSPLDLPLEQETNLAALLLRLNRCHRLEHFAPVLSRFLHLLEQPQHHDLRPVLAAWVLQVLNKKHKLGVTADDLAPLWLETHMGLAQHTDQFVQDMILKVTGKTVDQLKDDFRVEFEQELTQRLEPEIAQRLEPEIERKARRELLLEVLVERFGDDPRWSALLARDLTLPQLQRLTHEAIAAPDKDAFCALASA